MPRPLIELSELISDSFFQQDFAIDFDLKLCACVPLTHYPSL